MLLRFGVLLNGEIPPPQPGVWKGERYFEHPHAVSLILLEQDVYDRRIMASALRHDLMEDTFILT